MNGFSLPEFETDADRTYIIMTLRIQEGFQFKNFAQNISEVLTQNNYNKVS